MLTADDSLLDMISDVICLVNNSNNIPVFLYLLCFGFTMLIYWL
jgi:hypothetical protein